MSSYESIEDVELTDEHVAFLEAAGASDRFLELIRFPKEAARVPRHSTQQEVKKYIFYGDLGGDPAEFRYSGGHFFDAMWRGDLFGAWLRADLNNKALLRECFGVDALIEAGVQNGEPLSYARTMVLEPVL
ncbi:hypothetical protein [Halapricum desulfuricans]|uniref:Uncharacterized protein n=1 Tax=Halapricum desulfuricans TaxID=2841257 RepID=A0A897N0A9_9EURY|nr:hypothetical protein [Halapricum desulfuricans]QSG06362.1 hypothetical protein HSR121_2030 [Halapricum desulfuricans]